MPLKLHLFIFIKYRLAVVVQLDDKPFSGLYRGDFYISVPDVAFFRLCTSEYRSPVKQQNRKTSLTRSRYCLVSGI